MASEDNMIDRLSIGIYKVRTPKKSKRKLDLDLTAVDWKLHEV